MPVFQYKALDSAGKSIQGLKEADSPKALRAVLKRDGVFLTEVLGAQEAKAQAAREVSVKRVVLGRVSSSDLAIMTRQFAVLVGAGIPLADALAALPKVFATLYVNMVRAGETSGALDAVLFRLADFTESQARLRSKILGTLAYPAFMLVIGSGVLGVLFAVVIPKIVKIFDDSKVALPWYTRALIGFTHLVSSWWWAMLLGAVAAGWGFVRWRATREGRAAWDRRVLTLPIFGRLIRIIAIGRVARTL